MGWFLDGGGIHPGGNGIDPDASGIYPDADGMEPGGSSIDPAAAGMGVFLPGRPPLALRSRTAPGRHDLKKGVAS